MTDLDVVTVEPFAGLEETALIVPRPPRTPHRPANGRPAPIPMATARPDWERLVPRGWYARRGKRLLDLALLTILLPLAVPPLALVALVNLVAHRDPRKVLFTQPRVGWRGREFTIYKFRTMTDAPRDPMTSWKNGTDPQRVTTLGRILRNTHLDELPQLLNILRGDMQFIGPRPEMVEVEHWAAERVPGFMERLAIRPGITGLAQITQGYAACDPEAYAKKLRLNRLYLNQVSLRLDVEIVFRTALWVLKGRGSKWESGDAPSPAKCSPAKCSPAKCSPAKPCLGVRSRGVRTSRLTPD